jgi:hypothetical protein
MNYTVIENDILPNVVCNTSFYDNNTLIANNQSTLTNGSITYSWVISQSPIHNFNWSITCIDPVNVTTSFTYSTGPYYYNEFNLYMEDSGNAPNNVTYSLTLECNDGSIQYSNANDENYTLYLWTNDQCNFVSISQNIQGITFDEGFSTNLLSNYGFQWPICLINISLTYYDNPLIGLQPYRDTLISVENPQTGCYLTGSYLYLSASNYYYEPVPMRPGALYAIRSNNTYLATIEGSTSQAISIDTLIAQTSYLNNQTILVVGYPTVNYTTYNGIPELIISAPANISSAVVSVYYNNQFYTNYTFNSVGSSTLNVILTNLPANYTFNDTNYAIITLTYISGYQQIITYPVNFFSKIALPSFLVYLISVIILYAWTRAFSYYQRLIIAGFGIVLIILLLSVFTINSMAPIVLDAGIFFFFIFDVISRTYLSELTQDHPLFKPISFAFKLFMVLSFVGTFIAFLFGPYGIYYIPISGISDYMSKMASLTQSMGSTISQMTNNMFFVPLGIITLAADLIYAIWLGIRVMAVFISAIITPFSVIFGPFAGTVANIIQALVTYGALVVIVVYLLLLVFALVDKLPF